ncbi:MAG: hypothetical protein R3F58_10660 [Steroidobacteraceae bacterium]
MNDKRSARDCRGNPVCVGDSVRVITIDPAFLAKLPKDEVDDVRSMIGEIFKVEEIDDQGSAWVWKWWERGNGRSESNGVALGSVEMELVASHDAN